MSSCGGSCRGTAGGRQRAVSWRNGRRRAVATPANAERFGEARPLRGLRVTVGAVVGLVAAGHTTADILREYRYLEAEDISAALSYAAWRAEEVEVPLGGG
jgi:uncharacterized protein (DUF433 family)